MFKYPFIILFFVTAVFSSSCDKGHEDSSPLVIDTVIVAPEVNERSWCKDKIACWGDSFTEGPGAWPYSFHLGVAYCSDSIIIGTYPNGYVDRFGKTDGGYLRKGSTFNGGVSGESSTQIKARFLADTVHRKWATIIWSGRNNSWDTLQIASDIAEMVNALGHEKYLILEVLNGNWEHEWKGTAYYNNVTSFNERMAEKYGKHFVYLKPYLQKFAKKTYEDSMCVVRDVTPTSLRFDELHLNNEAYRLVAENIVQTLGKCEEIK